MAIEAEMAEMAAYTRIPAFASRRAANAINIVFERAQYNIRVQGVHNGVVLG